MTDIFRSHRLSLSTTDSASSDQELKPNISLDGILEELGQTNDPAEKYPILEKIIQYHDAQRNFVAASGFQRQLVDVALAAYGETSKQYMDAKFLLAVYYWKSEQPHLAQPELESLLRVIKAVHGENHVFYWRVLSRLGTLCYYRTDYEASYRLHYRCFELSRFLFQPNERDVAQCCISLARAAVAFNQAENKQLNDPKDIIAPLEQALTCKEISDHASEKGRVYTLMADAYALASNHKKELGAVRKAVASYQSSSGKRDSATLTKLREREVSLAGRHGVTVPILGAVISETRMRFRSNSLRDKSSEDSEDSPSSHDSLPVSGSSGTPVRKHSKGKFFMRMFQKSSSRSNSYSVSESQLAMKSSPHYTANPHGMSAMHANAYDFEAHDDDGATPTNAPQPPRPTARGAPSQLQQQPPARQSGSRTSSLSSSHSASYSGPSHAASSHSASSHSASSHSASSHSASQSGSRASSQSSSPSSSASSVSSASSRHSSEHFRAQSRNHSAPSNSHSYPDARQSATPPLSPKLPAYDPPASPARSRAQSYNTLNNGAQHSRASSPSALSRFKSRELELLDQLHNAKEKIMALEHTNRTLAGQLEMTEARCETLEMSSKQAQVALSMMNRSSSRPTASSSSALSRPPDSPSMLRRPGSSASKEPRRNSEQSDSGAPDEITQKQVAALRGDTAVLATLDEHELVELISLHQQALVASQAALLEARERSFRKRIAVEQEAKYDKNTCKVCLDEPVEIVLQPCAHACLCINCSQEVKICPICRAPISNRLQIFI